MYVYVQMYAACPDEYCVYCTIVSHEYSYCYRSVGETKKRLKLIVSNMYNVHLYKYNKIHSCMYCVITYNNN